MDNYDELSMYDNWINKIMEGATEAEILDAYWQDTYNYIESFITTED